MVSSKLGIVNSMRRVSSDAVIPTWPTILSYYGKIEGVRYYIGITAKSRDESRSCHVLTHNSMQGLHIAKKTVNLYNQSISDVTGHQLYIY